MIVVDASALVNAFTDDGEVGEVARDVLADDLHWAAPEHLFVESFSAIRGRCRGRAISTSRADSALGALRDAAIDVYSTRPLLDRMWELRGPVSGYDAAYVALAESLTCSLVTADRRLSGASGTRCHVQVAAPAGREHRHNRADWPQARLRGYTTSVTPAPDAL